MNNTYFRLFCSNSLFILMVNSISLISAAPSSAKTPELTKPVSLMDYASLPSVNSFNMLWKYAGYDYTSLDFSQSPPHYLRKEAHIKAGRKFLRAAAQAGFRTVRVVLDGPISEYSGSYELLQLWKNHPQEYWQALDLLVQDAIDLNIILIPVLTVGFVDKEELDEFPACKDFSKNWPLVSFIPKSRNREMKRQHIQQIITRYKASPGILMWEIANEINLHFQAGRPVTTGTTEYKGCLSLSVLLDYIQEISSLIHSIDKLHPVASGTMQQHNLDLALAKPTGSKDPQRWNMADYFLAFNKTTDVAPIHVYPHEPGATENPRKFIEYYAQLARDVNKSLWIGEWAPTSTVKTGVNPLGTCGNYWWQNPDRRFVENMVTAARSFSVLLTAWNWEDPQWATWGRHDGNTHHCDFEIFNLVPGKTDSAIQFLTRGVW